jgi:hypothetical protein
VSKADVAIGMIRKLYRIESKIEGLEPEQKREQRQQLSVPLLDDLKAWLEKNANRVPKDSLTYTAIQYMLNQWEGPLRLGGGTGSSVIRQEVPGRAQHASAWWKPPRRMGLSPTPT